MGKGRKSSKCKGRETQKSSVCSSTSKVFCMVGDGVCVCACACVHMCSGKEGRQASDQKDFTEKVTFDERLRGSEEVSHMDVWEKSQLAGRGNVKCKGPEARGGLASFEQQGDPCG